MTTMREANLQEQTNVENNAESMECFAAFIENAEKIGAEVHRVPDIKLAVKKIGEMLTELRAERVIAATSALVTSLNLSKLTKIKVDFDRQEALEAQVGICQMELAVAETGSLCQIDPTMEERWASSLPDINIALVSSDRLIDTFEEAMKKVYEQYSLLPGYISFVSGPSRTSDIERVLTIGVHGPRRLIIIFVDDPNGGN